MYKHLSIKNEMKKLDRNVNEYFKHTHGHTEQVHICSLMEGSFVGEEILFSGMGTYEFTIQASTNTKVYMIEKGIFALRFPKEVYEGIKRLYEIKVH